MTNYFIEASIYLSAAVITVPIAKKLGLGSVLGYLIAGVIIGPLTGLVGSETLTIQHFAEFGVVMMLFLIGLELEPAALWKFRYYLLGLGGSQVLICSILITFICLLLRLNWQMAIAIGLILSVSSTAIVLQTLQEKKLDKSKGGKSAFAVLLFQDIAVIPMLAIIPMLAQSELINGDQASPYNDLASYLTQFPGWIHAIFVLFSIATVIIVGHYLSRPLFRFIAQTELRELFTATALLLVISIAILMNLVGLSPALGTFLAGVVLANSEFRNELQNDLEPFKGILLGLFFITVGAEIDFKSIVNNINMVIMGVLTIVIIKGLVLFILAKLFRIRNNDGWLFTLSLCQAGEFGFVLLSFCLQNKVLSQATADILSPVIAITMFLTPFLFILFDKIVIHFYQNQSNQDNINHQKAHVPVIIAGIGRFGQIVNRLLQANDIPTVIMDSSALMVDKVSKINVKTWYGDASRPDLLQCAGIKNANILIVAIDNPKKAIELVKHVHYFYPKVKILARAFDRGHGYDLTAAGAKVIITETYYSALELGGEALQSLGVHPFKVEQIKLSLQKLDQEHREIFYQAWHKEEGKKSLSQGYLDLFLEVEDSIMNAIKENKIFPKKISNSNWEPPPKNYMDFFE